MEERLNKLKEYKLTEIPCRNIQWKYPKMYKKDSKGSKREWFGAVIDGGIVTSYGLVDGLKILTEPYKVEINNSGRSFIEQAALELRSRYEIKNRKEGYRFPGELKFVNIKPMLANDYNGDKPKSFKLYYPVAIQPKLDGVRCLVRQNLDTGKLVYRSRQNKLWDFDYLFSEEINSMMPFFPFQVELDGELYIHEYNLQKINSIVSMKTTEDEIETLKGQKKIHAEETLKLRRDHLKYYIFTIITPDDMVYEDRNHLLLKAYTEGEKSLGRKFERVFLVEDHLAYNLRDIEKYLTYYTDKLKYEGIMIYKLGLSLPENNKHESYYKSTRTWNLIKYKKFFDEEMKVVDVKKGKGKAAELAGTILVDKFGINHDVNIAEDDEFRKEVLKNPKSIIGKEVTVKHYGRTDDGKLRHATVICIRDYE